MDLCFLDLETTGFEPKDDSIIEVSFVRFKDGKKVATYDQVFAPDKSPLNDFVSNLTGISQAELDQEGQQITGEAQNIAELIGDSTIVGHNIDFDINFLIGNDIDVSQNPRLDTHELARILLPLEDSYALEVLSRKYGFTHTDAHRAMSDVLASKSLFELLLEKIAQLPTAYLAAVRECLETKTDWYAKALFLAADGVVQSDFYQKDNFYIPPKVPTAALDLEVDMATTRSFRLGENMDAAQKTIALAQTLVSQGAQVLVVSPKLDYFLDLPKLPTPEVILDPSRLQQFGTQKLDNLETTFYLQCQLRHHLGFRGVFFFDLFFKMRGMWRDICVLDADDKIFRDIVAEKSKEPILALSPEALFRFVEMPELADRGLIFDEAEFTADRLLQAPTKTFSFAPYLNREDEVGTAAQFLIHRFCREIIEPQLGHQITPYGVKLPLHPGERLDEFGKDLEGFLSGEDLAYWQQWLSEPAEKLVRWVSYSPRTGNLSWHAWHPDDWRSLKEKLEKFPKIFGYRYPFLADENAFWRVFFGVVEREDLELGLAHVSATLEIPPNLISHTSPDFNGFCSDQIAQAYRATDKNLVANFSSLDTMRHCFDDLNKTFITDENFAVFGEKVSGGDGKLWQQILANKDKKQILCTQKMLKPALAEYDTDTLVIQKFPFSAPHPLLQKIEEVMKQSGQSWWDTWVVPQLVANLHRRVGNFSNLKKVIWLDPRENSRWGKVVLRKVFGIQKS